MEEWKILNKPYDSYAVSNYGNVKNIKTNTIKKSFVRYDGYMQVALSLNGKNKTFKVHRLVAEMFLDNKNMLPCVNHKDGNKINNHIENLEWVTHSQNNYHAVANGLVKSIPIKIIDTSNNNEYTFHSITQGSKFIKADKRLISKIIKGKDGVYKQYIISKL